ncbi:MAG: hypothetical protein KME21_29390 [Desmonostoc vinosum HA7617-LM4]|nr:hypothetical protein [Desmonostoc vinosum HA7617-LM4]
MSELKKLEFSKPITRYESTAIYNNQGHKLLIKAYGNSKNEIEERTKNLSISLNISTDESSIPEAENPLDSPLETDISSEDENLENIIQPLDISIDPLTITNLEPGRKLNFVFENILPDRIWRVLENGNLQAVPLTSSSTEVYITSPLTEVGATITVQRGSANFSLYKSTTGQGNWQFVKKIPVSTARPEVLRHRENQNKYFKLMVQGVPGTSYIVRGDWVVN